MKNETGKISRYDLTDNRSAAQEIEQFSTISTSSAVTNLYFQQKTKNLYVVKSPTYTSNMPSRKGNKAFNSSR